MSCWRALAVARRCPARSAGVRGGGQKYTISAKRASTTREEGEQATARLAKFLAIVAAEVLAHPFPSLLLLRGGTERKGMVKRRKKQKWDPLLRRKNFWSSESGKLLESEHHEGEGEQAAAHLAEVFAIMAAEVLAHPFPSLLLLRGGTERKEMVKRRKTQKWDPLSGEEKEFLERWIR
jgi:hypothetical protein